jgi:hypothetical protein
MITPGTDNCSCYTYQLAGQGCPKEADGRSEVVSGSHEAKYLSQDLTLGLLGLGPNIWANRNNGRHFILKRIRHGIDGETRNFALVGRHATR